MEREMYVREAFEFLSKVNTKMVMEFNSLFNHEITQKQLLILQIVRDVENITVNEISQQTGLSLSSVSQLIGRLEKENYLKRQVNINNRREVFVSLDSEADLLFENYNRVDSYLIEKYYSEFSVEEVKQFRNLVKKLYNVMEQKGEEK
ncbi:MarR family winged helix-turn-helix transcriptional regulator [Metabacillus endolithicus]|uniref:MarR family winged helix-turn-helix transcriptional regulator n=1 Tax=Metabacillus endolithicus TaxID=1535204 RepID=A0ABW5C6D4_9BACI|nr:MarR family transcriptional regulator [Metabacillus endolithicus]UPG63915.1 MarR family transcriptional regulator [Metabacillus endolithicus]